MRQTKSLFFDKEALEKLQRGVNAMGNAVGSTLGPKGRVAIMENPYGAPFMTKDGVTVSRNIQLEDPMENMGAELLRAVAEKTVSQCGDGTTTSCILAQAIFNEGLKAIQAGVNPVELKKGIDFAVEKVVEYIKANAIPVNDDWEKVKNIAIISTNNDIELGTLIADTLKKIGKHGAITVETSNSNETTVDFVEGMSFDKGYISPNFITNPAKNICELSNPYILLFDKDINSLADLVSSNPKQPGVVDQVMNANRPLVIIANDVEGAALSALVVNKLNNKFPSVCIYAPSQHSDRKSIYEDIAIVTGANVISEEFGRNLKTVRLQDLGECDKIIVSNNSTVIIGGKGEKALIDKRISDLSALIAEPELSEQRKEFLTNRLAKIASGIAIIKVGGITESEAKEKKDRVDDAVGATKSAIKEGICPGGGSMYMSAKKTISVDSKSMGEIIIRVALMAPFESIVKSTGNLIGDMTYFEGNFGFNASTEKIEDLVLAGVIDPAMVLRCCLENAASIVGLMLTSNVSIIYNEQDERKS